MDAYVYRGYTIRIAPVPVLQNHYNAHVLDPTGYEVWANGTYSARWLAVDAAQWQVNMLARSRHAVQPGDAALILHCRVCGREERVSDLDAISRLRQTWLQDFGGWRHVKCGALEVVD